MGRVLLIRPNDFLADAMAALVKRAGFEVSRVRTLSEFQELDLGGAVGAVVSTAVTSTVPMTFAEAVVSFRRRSAAGLVATTMLKDDTLAMQYIDRELAGSSLGMVTLAASSALAGHPQLGTSRGLLVLRKDQIEAPEVATLELLKRHFEAPT